MKSLIFKLAIFAVVLLSGCRGDRYSYVYTLELPEPPAAWVSLLGQPNWKVEWLNTDGQKMSKNILPGQNAEIAVPVTFTNPVTAWPWWSGLAAGFFKPAGALFPFDVSGEKLSLSWEAGPDTVFYWELAAAYNQNEKKIPANFDWLRFRELFWTDILSGAVREDPWLIDWKNVAEKTISSNFDRRRLVPRVVESVSIEVHSGPWYGTSPFAEPLRFAEGETPVFPVGEGDNLWISREGILRRAGKIWVFTDTP